MPQVDLDTLVSVCGVGHSDRKIICETLAGDYDDSEEDPRVPADFPPESFWLSKDAEFDWFDRNAFLERKESTKGNFNSNHNHSNSNSQRFSANLKSKAAMIGFPKTPKTTFAVDLKRRNCRAANAHFFPKRSGSIGKNLTVSATEPSSPKVSCMGRVRSKRCRAKNPAPVPAREEGRKGLISSLASLFRSDGKRSGKTRLPALEPRARGKEPGKRKNAAAKAREFPVHDEKAPDPPSLGGAKRFASGRRSESWGSIDDDVANLHSLDLGRREQ